MQTPPSHPLWRQARRWDPSAEGQQALAFRSEHRQEERVSCRHVLLLKPTLGPSASVRFAATGVTSTCPTWWFERFSKRIR